MKRAWLAIGILLLAVSGAGAEVRTHDIAKVSIDVPHGWKVDAEESSMTITDPKEEIAFFLIVLDSDDIKKALDALDSEVGKSFNGVKWEDEPKNMKLNGMEAMTLDGEAKADGKPVDLGVLLVATPAKKILLVLGAVEHAKAKQHEKTVEKFMTSIKPIR